MKKNYLFYRQLSKKEKQKRIDQAEQRELDRSQNPQKDHHFQQENFIDFFVQQKKQKIRLHTYRYKSKEDPIAIVVMLHGLNSYLGHGAHIAHQFSLNNITTVGFDHRGFGKSEGQPGYAESLQNHISDSLKFIKIMQKIYQGLPFFCLGLSMGGMTSYYLTLKYPQLFQGAILMAPALKNQVGGFLVGFTKTLASILPKKTKLMKPIYGKASSNPQITDDVKNDKWAFSQRACLSTITMLVATMDKTPQTFKHYKSPFIIFQGGLDKLVNPQGAFQLYDQSATRLQDKELQFFQSMWHDIWHQKQIFYIIQRSIGWIKRRVKLREKKQHQIKNKQMN